MSVKSEKQNLNLLYNSTYIVCKSNILIDRKKASKLKLFKVYLKTDIGRALSCHFQGNMSVKF